jgi:antitoxin (DNA-binding transcriptional repressor) of toxin-antitoxin stability system
VGTAHPWADIAGVATHSASSHTRATATTIAQREPRNDVARVLAAVAAGESFVSTRHGRPGAGLRPIVAGRRAVVPISELAALFREGPAVDAAAFSAEVDQPLDSRLPVASTSDDPMSRLACWTSRRFWAGTGRTGGST